MGRAGAVLPLAIAILAMLAVAWNGARFIGTKQRPRTKALDLLPPPVVARAFALGQPTALAKLRWIDSFAYFQLQLDRLDDRVPGADGRGGMERLYDTLIDLDPHFQPFYDHAVLNTSGVLKQHQAALAFLMRGLIANPRHTHLWRLAATELAVSFDWSKRAPDMLDRWLAAWAEADPEGRQQVLDWRRGLAFAHVEGLTTLPYWLEQLRGTKPGTPLAEFVEGTVRDLLAEHGARELTRLAGGDERFPDRLLRGSLLPWAPVAPDPAAVARRWPRGAPATAPVVWNGQDGALRPDPFGWPWRWQGDRVVSPGREQRRFLQGQQIPRLAVQAEAEQRGRPPRDAAEAAAWGIVLPAPPDGGRWLFRDALPEVAWPAPPHPPWRLR